VAASEIPITAALSPVDSSGTGAFEPGDRVLQDKRARHADQQGLREPSQCLGLAVPEQMLIIGGSDETSR
jgi:anti-sigma factor ChrR (cupin superfamily)